MFFRVNRIENPIILSLIPKIQIPNFVMLLNCRNNKYECLQICHGFIIIDKQFKKPYISLPSFGRVFQYHLFAELFKVFLGWEGVKNV